jgi:hypothetical protein
MIDNDPDANITNTNAEPLAAIKVGVLDNEGFVKAVITMEEFVRTADSQELYFHN